MQYCMSPIVHNNIMLFHARMIKNILNLNKINQKIVFAFGCLKKELWLEADIHT